MRLIEAAGPWPFVTRKTLQHADGALHVLLSRAHRKDLLSGPAAVAADRAWWHSLWLPRQINWWIGVLFALGSVLFALGSALSLDAALAHAWAMSTTAVNAVYFAGSIPFTSAAALQLYQAASAAPFAGPATRRPGMLAWRPHDIGWLSSALQFAGTLLFNLSTYAAMALHSAWWMQDLAIWAPDLFGSILFLASGYLAFIETCHAHWAWRPRSLAWWVTFTNLLGCIAFMASALLAYVPQQAMSALPATLATVFTLLGALGFLVGALLSLPEALAASVTP
ncbi:MAG: hypothetical protein M9915_17335 [Rhizobacter sp.]|nr:hypothetical protein [Rhizobacter sp.]